MRLLFIVYGSIDTLSGGYLYDRMLIRALGNRGHQVRVLSQKPRQCYLAHLTDNLDGAFVRAAVDFTPDLVLEDELNHPSLFILNRRLKAALGVPIVGIVHHLRQLERNGFLDAAIARFIERRFLHGLDGFIFNSAFTRDSVSTALGKGAAERLGKPCVIALPGKDRLSADAGPAPTAAPPFKLQSGSEDRPPEALLRILFLGNVIARKGLHVLVSALGRLSREEPELDWSLGIVGNAKVDPGYATRIAMSVGEQGLGGRIAWLGAVGDDELPGVFQSHDVLAVPSQCEGYGIVYAEAMRFGLPVIAGLYGGAPEIVDDGSTGYLVPWGDDRALARCLAALMRDRALLARMGEAARRRADTLPAWEESMVKASEFLESIIL